MIDPEITLYIRKEIQKFINIILSGESGSNTSHTESISNLYPGMPTIDDRPIMHPYGIVSRAPSNTLQVTARQGEHPGNRIVLGHRDKNRPILNSGETCLYNQYGQNIYLESGKIHIGKKTTSNPAPVGNELLDFLGQLCDFLKDHTHTGNLGVPTPLSPSSIPTITNLKANNISNKKIVSDYIFLEKTP